MTKLEQIARAIAPETWKLVDRKRAAGQTETWQGLANRSLEAARRVVAAMREPSEAMLEASNREWDGRMSYRSSGAWKACCDAILSETEARS